MSGGGEDPLGQILERARSFEMVAATPAAPGNAWYCNACGYVTAATDEACEHAIQSRRDAPQASHPFDHLLYERAGREERAVRRIHPIEWKGGALDVKVMAVPQDQPGEGRKRPLAPRPEPRKGSGRKKTPAARKQPQRPQEKGLL